MSTVNGSMMMTYSSRYVCVGIQRFHGGGTALTGSGIFQVPTILAGLTTAILRRQPENIALCIRFPSQSKMTVNLSFSHNKG